MVHIKIKKGLDIPIKGKPSGKTQQLIPGGEASSATPKKIALNLKPFEDIKFKLLAKAGDTVKIGQPIAFDKAQEKRMFVSPAGGVVREVRRGLKRRLLDIVIDVDSEEQAVEHTIIDIDKASREEILERLLEGGLFANIRRRPFNRLANPTKTPQSIFVKAIESAPFTPSAEQQVEGYEKEFQAGLNALTKLTQGPVHLVYRQGTSCKAFTDAQNVEKHTTEGPHPVANHSLHIEHIDPITSVDHIIWTVTAHDVVSIGYLLTKGRYFTERVISIAGPGIVPDRTGYFKVRAGYPIEALIAGRIEKGLVRLISGDPLMGEKVEPDEYLGYYHTAFCAIPENTHREFMHFFRLGINKYSFSRAYFSGLLDNTEREYDFTTNQHGEHRPFIDATLYDQVMPLQVSTMPLVKAVLAEDLDLAEELGLLSVDGEDFALPTFVCMSKMEMTDIIKQGLKRHALEVME